MSSSEGSPAFRFGDVALYAVAVAGLAASLTVVFLGMRAVMDVGGFCAEGGPYRIETPCPEGVPLLMIGGIFGLFGVGALMAGKGSAIGGPYGGLVLLAWSALFISLGWNFLEYAIWPPAPADGIVWGWLVPGVIFVIMGAVPLFAVLPDRAPQGAALRRARGQLLDRIATRAAQRGWSVEVAGAGTGAGAGRPAEGDLVSKLERLAALRSDGSLTADEFDQAKRALLDGEGRL